MLLWITKIKVYIPKITSESTHLFIQLTLIEYQENHCTIKELLKNRVTIKASTIYRNNKGSNRH